MAQGPFSGPSEGSGGLTEGDLGDITVSGGVVSIDNKAVSLAQIQDITSDRLLGRDTASSGSIEQLTVSGGIEFTGSGGIQRSALSGDVSAAAGSNTTAIVNDAVTFAKLQNVATDKLLGRDTASTGDVEEISVGGGLEFTGSTGVQRSALTGDVSAAAGSSTTTIGAGVVSYAKMQDVSATQRVLGRNSSGSGDVEEVTATQLLDWINSTRGSVLYRGASGWTGLSPGTSGNVLTSNGAGADPSYQTPAASGLTFGQACSIVALGI